MNPIILNEITLLGIDCVDIERLIFAAEVCQKYMQFKEVKLMSNLSKKGYNIIKIDPITSKEEYSFFIIKELYKYINTKYVLIIQWDGFILNPFNWSDEFLRYDYIGAPWWWHNDDSNVGNGGFSLRSRKLLESIASDDNINIYHPEDEVICKKFGEYLKRKGFKFAPEDIASRFSIERKRWEDQFGFHYADISDWEIHKFTDPQKHAKYIEQFYHYFH